MKTLRDLITEKPRLYYVGITALRSNVLYDLMYDINGVGPQVFGSRSAAQAEMETAWKVIKEKLNHNEYSDYNMTVLRNDDPRVVEYFRLIHETNMYNLIA